MFNDEKTVDEPLTDTGQVAKAVREVRAQLAQDVKDAVREALQERDKETRSFLRAVFDALWSGATQAHAALQKILK